AVWADGNAFRLLVEAEHRLQSTSRHIPDRHEGARQHQASIGTEGQCHGPLAALAEREDQLSRRRVPEAHRPTDALLPQPRIGECRDPLSIRTEHSPFARPSEGQHDFSVFQIPDIDISWLRDRIATYDARSLLQ